MRLRTTQLELGGTGYFFISHFRYIIIWKIIFEMLLIAVQRIRITTSVSYQVCISYVMYCYPFERSRMQIVNVNAHSIT